VCREYCSTSWIYTTHSANAIIAVILKAELMAVIALQLLALPPGDKSPMLF